MTKKSMNKLEKMVNGIAGGAFIIGAVSGFVGTVTQNQSYIEGMYNMMTIGAIALAINGGSYLIRK